VVGGDFWSKKRAFWRKGEFFGGLWKKENLLGVLEFLKKESFFEENGSFFGSFWNKRRNLKEVGNFWKKGLFFGISERKGWDFWFFKEKRFSRITWGKSNLFWHFWKRGIFNGKFKSK
jgi:hypothetical protein